MSSAAPGAGCRTDVGAERGEEWGRDGDQRPGLQAPMIDGDAAPVPVELYLRDRVLRGDVRVEGRTLDTVNRPGRTIELRGAQSTSFHTAAPPRRLGHIRVEKAHVLLIRPDDAGLARTLHGAWKPTRRVLAEAGLGPLAVRGIFHLNPALRADLAHLLSSGEERLFLPVTQATVTAEYHPGWSVEFATVFLLRTAIEFVSR